MSSVRVSVIETLRPGSDQSRARSQAHHALCANTLCFLEDSIWEGALWSNVGLTVADVSEKAISSSVRSMDNGRRMALPMNDEQLQREIVCYEQNFEQARSLNNQMNRVPVLSMTLTGGLWFAAGITEDLQPIIRFGLLIFAGCCNLALIAAALRIRDVFHSYLEQIKKFNPDSFANGKPESPKVPLLKDYSMIGIYCILMGVGGLLSFSGALAFYWPFTHGLCIGLVCVLAVVGSWFLRLFAFRRRADTV